MSTSHTMTRWATPPTQSDADRDLVSTPEQRRLHFDEWGLAYQYLDGVSGDALTHRIPHVDEQARLVLASIGYDFSGTPTVFGDTRGEGAIDLQTIRTVSSRVASGNGSVLFGGAENTAAGAFSAVLGGTLNTAEGMANTIINGTQNNTTSNAIYATILGGNQNEVSGLNSAIVGGQENKVSGSRSVSLGGVENEVAGAGSATLGGQDNNVSGSRSVSLGGLGLEVTTNDTAVAQNFQMQTGSGTESFFALTQSAANATTIQSRNSNANVQMPANAPNGTIFILRNAHTTNEIIYTLTEGDFIAKPEGQPLIVNQLVMMPNSTAIAYKLDNNLILLSYYDPAMFDYASE